MKRTRIIICILLVAVLLAVALYFLLPVKLVDANVVEHVVVTASSENIALDGEELSEVTDLLEQTKARRCFAPAQLYYDDAALELSVVTDDAALHIVLGEESYLYSSVDDTIWYSVIDAEQLRSNIEKVIS